MVPYLVAAPLNKFTLASQQVEQAISQRPLRILGHNVHIFTGRVFYYHTLYGIYAYARLKANDPMTNAEMRGILLKLAHRLITAAWKQAEVHPDRLYLYTTILHQLGLYKDARELLDTESGRFVCARNLSCDYLRREIMKAGGWQTEEGDIAEKRIVEKRSVIYIIPDIFAV